MRYFESLCDLILDKRLNPLEGLAGDGGGLDMTDMSVKGVKNDHEGSVNATQNTAHAK